jgi:hypothetical protein
MSTKTISTATAPVHPLIESDRVEGTPVVNANGGQIGTIKRLMIEKVSGRIVYAIMSFGGFLGIGEHERVVPWGALHYSQRWQGYQLDRTADEIRSAPEIVHGETDRERETALHEHYDVPPYWHV